MGCGCRCHYRPLISSRHAGPTLCRSYATAVELSPKTDPALVPKFPALLNVLKKTRDVVQRPLSLSEKILYSHLHPEAPAFTGRGPVRGESYLQLAPARVAMQDASAQLALLQFATCGSTATAVPASIHCDHLISAYEGAEADTRRAIVSNKEVYDFLESAARKYGIEFWRPNSGIIHQIVLENYAAPGLLMLGTDSHTPNAGGLGAIAIGVGGADAVDALAGVPWELKAPRLIGVELTGQLTGWASPKDVILKLAGELTVNGGKDSIIEYYGKGVESISATGTATICNMGAEVGATTSVFPYSSRMRSYLHATGRSLVAEACDKATPLLAADEGCEYDRHISINLSELEPHLNGPFTPDLSTPLSKFAQMVREKGWKDEISASLIGSCTNSSYEDMGRAASIVRQAQEHGLKAATSFMVTPGSELINATIERDGLKSTFESAGAVVLANACGPCIGQWDRREYKGQENSVLTSFNRNFAGRNDGNRKTMNFLTSPELVTAMAFSGRLTFNPLIDSLEGSDGKPFRFEAPSAEELPATGFTPGNTTYTPSPSPQPDPSVAIAIDPNSSRLEVLEPFDGNVPSEVDPATFEIKNLRCLLRVRGKCTTDDISAAGPWLKYKGHLSAISENTLIGAMNDETGRINSALDYEDQSEATVPEMAKRWKQRGQSWLVVADSGYGEGSAREHAALQPRFLGCRIIVARSFARIHATNLKKQGILPLTFKNPEDYKLIGTGDQVSTIGLHQLIGRSGERAELSLHVLKSDGSEKTIPVAHDMSNHQINWFREGSALNAIRARNA